MAKDPGDATPPPASSPARRRAPRSAGPPADAGLGRRRSDRVTRFGGHAAGPAPSWAAAPAGADDPAVRRRRGCRPRLGSRRTRWRRRRRAAPRRHGAALPPRSLPLRRPSQSRRARGRPARRRRAPSRDVGGCGGSIRGLTLPHARRRRPRGGAWPSACVADRARDRDGRRGARRDRRVRRRRRARRATATAPATATATATATPRPRAVATIEVGQGPDGVAVSGGRVFVANQRGGTLSVIDPETERAPPASRSPPARARTASSRARASCGSASAGSDAVQRFETQARARPRPPRSASATGPRRSRSASSSCGSPTSTTARSTASTAPTPDVVGGPIGVGREPAGIFVGRRFVWVTNSEDDTVTRIDPSTAQVVGDADPRRPRPARRDRDPERGLDRQRRRRHRHPPGPPHRQAARRPDHGRRRTRASSRFGFGSVWVTNNDDNTVTRLDEAPAASSARRSRSVDHPLGIATGAGAVWVANHESDTVTRIQP